MRCLTCHNPETIPEVGQLEPLSPDQVLQKILPYKAFIDGVTLTGGECSLQGDFLRALCQTLWQAGLPVLIDSNGLALETLEGLAPWIDGIMMDIKSAEAEEHLALTGVAWSKVKASFERLLDLNLICEVRTVVHPDLQWRQTLAWVAQTMGQASRTRPIRYKIIGFRAHGVKGPWARKAAASGDFLMAVEAYVKDLGLTNYLIV